MTCEQAAHVSATSCRNRTQQASIVADSDRSRFRRTVRAARRTQSLVIASRVALFAEADEPAFARTKQEEDDWNSAERQDQIDGRNIPGGTEMGGEPDAKYGYGAS